jgi:hypothetical protein
MVFINDRECVFDVPINKAWKQVKAHSTDGCKSHPGAKNGLTEMVNGQVFSNS